MERIQKRMDGSNTMTRLLVSITKRKCKPNEQSTFLCVYDLENKRILRWSHFLEPVYRDVDPNPRGGLRGTKGISIDGNRIAIANPVSIFLYSQTWNPLGVVLHPSFAQIHDILLKGDDLWLTSSRNDLAACISMDGKINYLFDARTLVKKLGVQGWQPALIQDKDSFIKGKYDFRDPRTHEEITTDSAHVNSMELLPDGGLLISLGQLKSTRYTSLLEAKKFLAKKGLWKYIEKINDILSLLFRTKYREKGDLVVKPATGTSIVIRVDRKGTITPLLQLEKVTNPSHSLRLLKDGTAIYLYTTFGELIHFDPGNGEIFYRETIGSIFLRGATQLPDGTLVLGDNGNLIHYDLYNRKVLSVSPLSDDPSIGIFDIAVLPDTFELPPESFVEHHDRLMPVDHLRMIMPGKKITRSHNEGL